MGGAPLGRELPAVRVWLEVLTPYSLLHDQLWAVPYIRDWLLIILLIYSLKLERPKGHSHALGS